MKEFTALLIIYSLLYFNIGLWTSLLIKEIKEIKKMRGKLKWI